MLVVPLTLFHIILIHFGSSSSLIISSHVQGCLIANLNRPARVRIFAGSLYARILEVAQELFRVLEGISFKDWCHHIALEIKLMSD